MTWGDVSANTEIVSQESARVVRLAAHPSSSRRLPFITILASLLVAGCTVGPDFKKPAAPDVSDYTARPPATTASSANVAGGEAQRFAKGGDIPADWWTLFHSGPLNALIEQSLNSNPDLKAAQAALSVARENVLAGRGAYYPGVTAGVSASRQQDPPGALAPVPSNNAFLYNLFTPQVSVSYVPDVFGLNRRSVESLKAQEQAVRFQAIATQVTLTANVVVAAIQQASLQAQVEATHQMIDIDTRMLGVLRYQFAKGYAGRLDVAAQESQLAQVAATLPPLLKQLAQQHDLLAVLAGRFPSQAPDEKFELPSLQLPQDLPLSLPSALVAQRPDVRQAEANMHAASAQVGVAIANRLPNILLTSNAGSTALAIGQVFKAGTGFWSLGADVAAPVFQGGTLLHQQRAAKAAYVQAAAQYRSTVLTAFQNVADTLAALEQDAEGLKAAASAADAAKVTLDLSQRQWKDGYAGYLSVLSAEQAYQQARINLVQAQANRYVDTAALYQALGGGWWHRAEPAYPAPTRNADEK
ncbi:efflux transporter outer membrane subunit [Rhodanobacter glycinis]|uniref:Efflux transporter outer membrane subunit n=1 Tax=Rhodanobacter glycinis TaxID=582702 RepID=A0A502C3Z4_9GAMM|nr:efflux transporter outer membrane subunit [Rhodanobacter glycinis]TPG07472.1 efflux transporter outer membrane subunit [Rhodanobacter glycinis]